MKVKLYTILLTILIIGCTIKKEIPADIEFTVLPNLKDSLPAVEVNFDYKSDKRGLITLRYENNSWGDNDVFNCIHELQVLPKPENIEFNRDSSLITIKTKPNLLSSINYKIIQDYKGPPLNQYRYRPMMDKNYFHVLGMRLFMIPDGIFESDSSKAKIKISYQSKSDEDIFHSSFGKENVQNIEVNRDDLYGSFIVGGDYRRYSFTYDNDSIYFITRGNWKAFTDQDILNQLKQTISSQRKFWNDPRKGNFSVSLTPTYETWYSIGGSGFSNSFVSFASNNEKVTLAQMKWLYNHELLHKWISRTIINENEVEQYWFSEGFTDYYAYKLMLKNDFLDVSEYVKILNHEVIIPHYQDPVNTIPNSELTFEEFWSNYAKYMKLPYRRGLLYAFLLDNQIKNQSNNSQSLDNLMIDLFQLSLNDDSLRLNQKVFIRNLLKYLNHPEVESDFEGYILEGNLIDFQDELPDGLSIEYQNNIPLLKLDSEDFSDLGKRLKL